MKSVNVCVWARSLALYAVATSLHFCCIHGAFAAGLLDKLISVDIPANTRLEDALIEWGSQSGLTLMVNTQTVEGKVTRAVKGTFTADKVLNLLLRNTGLTYKQEGDRIQVIVSPVVVPSRWSDERNGVGVSASYVSDASPSASEAPRLDQIQEVRVTAERREESEIKVPISISVLTQKTMDDLQIQTVSDLATVVPGLVITPGIAFQDHSEIGIRGIYSTAGGDGIGVAPTTQIYIDETPIAIRELSVGFSKSPWPNIFDLDRVEVLRGPQGTLFGASAMGGAIRFITPQPNLTQSSGTVKADVSYTEHGTENYEAGFAYGAPIVAGTAAFRASGWFQSEGGFIDREDPFTGQILRRNENKSQSYVIRPAFTVAPLDGLTITPALFLQHVHDDNNSIYWLTELPNSPPEGSHAWGGIQQPLTDDFRVFSVSVKYDFGNISFVSDSSYLHRISETLEDTTHLFEYAFAKTPFIPGLNSFIAYDQNNSFTHAWQQEFRLSSQDPASRVSWVTGAYYHKAVQGLQQLEPPDLTPVTEYAYGLTSDQIFGSPNYVLNGQVLNYYGNYHSTDISEAVFGDVTFAILPSLKLDVGVRYEHLTVQDQTQSNRGPIGGGSSDVTLPDVVANPVTPRASLTYQITDTAMVYASVAKGSRPGGGNAVSVINGNSRCQPSLNALGYTTAPDSFAPDSLWSYEFGSKDLFFDRKLSVEASAFYIRWSNIQTSVDLPSCTTGFIGNRGLAISKGFDLQIAAVLTEDFKVGAVAGYTDIYFPNAAYGAPDPNTGIIPTLNTAGGKVANVIPWTAAANAQFSHSMDSLWPDSRAYLRLDYRWSGKVTPDPASDPNVAGYDPEQTPFADRSYGILNVRLGMTHDRLDLSAYVNNATNADPILGYGHNGRGSPLFTATAVRPLTAGLTAWWRY